MYTYKEDKTGRYVIVEDDNGNRVAHRLPDSWQPPRTKPGVQIQDENANG